MFGRLGWPCPLLGGLDLRLPSGEYPGDAEAYAGVAEACAGVAEAYPGAGETSVAIGVSGGAMDSGYGVAGSQVFALGLGDSDDRVAWGCVLAISCAAASRPYTRNKSFVCRYSKKREVTGS
mmetsp:Transcript_50836/g.147582  ORF Transcript_50836/g.147582 Transcript_50836/m.147582 type:complete len:122 (-) Transcript_50836:64-429(-)